MFSQLIGVVWSCSPGPGLSRARRGPGVPSERVRSSRSVCRAPGLSFPLAPWGGWGRQGLGAASGPDLPSPVPRLGVSSGAVGLRTQQMLLLRLPGMCPRSGPPAVGRVVPLQGCAPTWVPRWALGGAPGALQVVPQVPEAERRCRFSLKKKMKKTKKKERK